MPTNFRRRRSILSLVFVAIIFIVVIVNSPEPSSRESASRKEPTKVIVKNSQFAASALDSLAIKGRAPKSDYSRQQFGSGWKTVNGCDTRNIILHRDMPGSIVDESCNVTSGVLHDPYTGKIIHFIRGSVTSADVQIDHVVALSDAWQKGAQGLTPELRIELANDPLELLAVDGPANQQKSDGDAATWLPTNKLFRCEYVARQIAVKQKYNLWLTQAEYNAISKVLDGCVDQQLPTLD